MNDIDRSVESMDFALRRRFIWHEVEVTKELLENAFMTGNFGTILQKNAGDAAKQITALNDVITGKGQNLGLNEQYRIAQGQFANLPNDKRDLDELPEFVWKYRLKSLLREYVRGEEEKKVDEFLDACEAALLGKG